MFRYLRPRDVYLCTFTRQFPHQQLYINQSILTAYIYIQNAFLYNYIQTKISIYLAHASTQRPKKNINTTSSLSSYTKLTFFYLIKANIQFNFFHVDYSINVPKFNIDPRLLLVAFCHLTYIPNHNIH